MIALPEFNKLIVHFESALFSYSLDLVVSVSRGHSTPKSLEDSAERLAQKDGNVLFFTAGRLASRTLGKRLSHISYWAFPFLIQSSRLCNQDVHACHAARTRDSSSGWKHTTLCGSRVILPIFWFCWSSRLLKVQVTDYLGKSQCLSRETLTTQSFFPRTWQFARPKEFISWSQSESTYQIEQSVNW